MRAVWANKQRDKQMARYLHSDSWLFWTTVLWKTQTVARHLKLRYRSVIYRKRTYLHVVSEPDRKKEMITWGKTGSFNPLDYLTTSQKASNGSLLSLGRAPGGRKGRFKTTDEQQGWDIFKKSIRWKKKFAGCNWCFALSHYSWCCGFWKKHLWNAI